MRTTSSGIKLAIFAIITVFLTAVLAATIRNSGGGSGRNYKADFTNVTGLEKGDDIRIAGVRVGSVTGIKLVNRTVAEVGFSADSSVPLTTTTTAQIRYRNIVGQRYIELAPGTTSGQPLGNGGLIPESQTAPALDLTALFNGFKPLFAALEPADVNRLSLEIIRTLQGEGGTVSSLLANTAQVTTAIASRDQVIGDVINNLNSVLTTVADHDQGLSDLITSLQQVVTNLAQDRGAIGDSLQNIANLATATEGLLREANPSLVPDVQQLNTLAGTLDTSKGQLNQELQFLPFKLRQIVRTATYGSWFNFYLCAVDGQIRLPDGTAVSVPKYTSSDKVCQS